MTTSCARQGLLLLLLPLSILGGVYILGNYTRQQIRCWQRYNVPFAAIHCEPPPGQDRAAFLAEVQYVSGLPDRFQMLDEDVLPRLQAAFAAHPWVEKVDQITVQPDKQVQVRLTYRTPVLAVLADDTRGDTLGPSLDSRGIKLPVSRLVQGLPILTGRTLSAAQPGKPCGDPAIEAAARTVAYLRPYQDRLHLKAVKLYADDLCLETAKGSRILWGRPVGAEDAGEASPELKVERLLYFCRLNGDLGLLEKCYEHDVRPLEQAIHRPLARAN
jgi:hypothetical protein